MLSDVFSQQQASYATSPAQKRATEREHICKKREKRDKKRGGAYEGWKLLALRSTQVSHYLTK